MTMFKIEIEKAIGGYILRVTGVIRPGGEGTYIFPTLGEGTYIFPTVREATEKAIELLEGR